MDVLEALQNSSKGKLKYDLDWKPTKLELDQCSKSPTISCKLSSLLNKAFQELSFDNEKEEEKVDYTKNSNTSTEEKEGRHSVKVLGPEYLDSTHVIVHELENVKKMKVEQRMEERRRLFERNSYQLNEGKKRTLSQLQEERRNKFLEEVQVLKQDLRNYDSQTAKSQRALALQHEKSAARASGKIQHLAELKKKIAEDQERNRMELTNLQKCHTETVAVFQQLESLIKNCKLQLHSNVGTILDEAKKVFDLSLNSLKDCLSEGKAVDGALQQIPQYGKIMKTLLNNAKQTVSDTENKAKKELEEKETKRKQEEEKKKQEEAKKNEEKLKASKALETLSTTISQSSMQEYSRLEKLLEKVNKSLEPLTSTTDKTVKKLRMALQRAVSTPINTISDQSPAHLMEKIKDLSKLLSGQPIESFGQMLSTSVHPNAPLYCKNLLALKIVQQGSQQVSSNHNAAFPLATVAIGIWSIFPDVGDLILAHFYQQCPFLVPMYIPRPEGMSDQEYFKKLGYLFENGEIEPRDKYLKRISGTIRLYAAIISSMPPKGSTSPHPHGAAHGWTWLARILNLPPKPDYTATALFEFLDVAGHVLLKQYGRQFFKLITLIAREMIPKIRQVTTTQSGPIVRLESFLEDVWKKRAMPKPEGYLDAAWWSTPGLSGVIGS